MEREELKNYMPHREPMLLVDRSEMVEENHVVSEYTVTGEEAFVQGHFPGNPIVPGVILCEIMAQSSILLMKDELDGKLALYAGLDNVRFKRVVKPGDTVVVNASLKVKRSTVIVVSATATVEGQMACKGDLSFFLTPKE